MSAKIPTNRFMLKGTLLLLGIFSVSPILHGQGYVYFLNRFNDPTSGVLVDAPVSDSFGVRLTGPNYWTQLYAADGLDASEHDLVAVGVPINFRTGAGAGYV